MPEILNPEPISHTLPFLRFPSPRLPLQKPCSWQPNQQSRQKGTSKLLHSNHHSRDNDALNPEEPIRRQ